DNSFRGDTKAVTIAGSALNLTIAPANAANAAALRQILPFLKAQPLGLKKSAGCGDRLGLATPGHIRAIRKSTMAPILAQQSMRENARTGRTPQEVLDDAMWGVFQEGWRNGFGADADHLKTTADIDVCAAAGYTFYTVDPGDYVDNNANHASLNEVRHKVQDLPWHRLDSNPDDLQKRLAGKQIELGDFSLTINQPDLLRAAAKYGAAVAHTAKMYRHLVKVMGQRPFELEMSVDETDTVTTPLEHIYIANELRRLGVKWVSLAPRYVGDFEKGVDYIGDLAAFERAFAGHMAVAKAFGPYKLSLHSGSDKFSIYPIVSKVAGDLVHLKTAGTSYLEALRAIAKLKPELFRDIVAFALERYPTDRATYHVSAEIEKVPGITTLLDESLPTLLENFHGREVLHVTFVSVLNHLSFRAPMFAAVRGDEDAYYQVLEAHFDRHLAPFG
ncbi:MAG: tagaturonate epimerase family protein, partial [Anaerolineae bacterium]